MSLVVLVQSGCGDDDDAAKPDEAQEDGGKSPGKKPIVIPGQDAGDDESEETVTLGDAGMRLVDCTDADDGAACGPNGGLICLDGACVPSRCGDGFVDPALEECDDENTDSGDGCDPDCGWTCTDDSMCDDGAACNGKERCLVDHTCELGAPAADGTSCSTAAIADGQCRKGACTPPGCGDMMVKGSEQCDDGNETPADGCEIDCTFSCEEDADCDDGSMCTGVETCDRGTHTCKPGEELRCSDTSECTTDSCDPLLGCQFVLIDGDGDHHASDALACGDDCDDARGDVYPGAAELCDDIDQDCDGDPMPKETPYWYQDCDRDTYAPKDSPRMQSCEEPTTGPCKWITRAPDPDRGTADCNDNDGNAWPGQQGWFIEFAMSTQDYEYNCNDQIDLRYPTGLITVDSKCTGGIIGTACTGARGWIGKPPKCSDYGDYTECKYISGRSIGIDSCQRTTYKLQQECH